MKFAPRGRKLEGYAALFDTEARIGGFTEVIKPGAFTGSLARDIVALVDHDAGRVLARTKSKTLRLAEDTRGLAFDLDVASTSYGRDVLALVERGDLGGMSFGFTVDNDGERWNGSKRELRAVTLHEISRRERRGRPTRAPSSTRELAMVVRMADLRLALARRYLETLR